MKKVVIPALYLLLLFWYWEKTPGVISNKATEQSPHFKSANFTPYNRQTAPNSKITLFVTSQSEVDIPILSFASITPNLINEPSMLSELHFSTYEHYIDDVYSEHLISPRLTENTSFQPSTFIESTFAESKFRIDHADRIGYSSATEDHYTPKTLDVFQPSNKIEVRGENGNVVFTVFKKSDQLSVLASEE
ncbi:hypothetical protein J4N45_05010 [Vibrio sp. SCSIO 43140]|uniref:hypothetical protein n=1 Tax=Vibrio sp. SCSIO 43140 TaxID=2819100 RepID=UPI0020761735|nr:hypothetical protein [Vibrio sp. SCSIO 43140]USD61329.1 hypothetical protein J4N45_05010 [Vibrio sp. SCSIO 43140]